MKLLFTSLFLLLFQFSGLAQCATKNTDMQAKAVLDGVSKKLKSFKTVNTKFTLRSENAAGKAMTSKVGTMIAKGNKYKLNITGQEIFCDGITVWTYDKASNEVSITKNDNNAATITPQKLFTNFYDKDFLYKLNGEKKEDGKNLQEIEMTPCNKTRPYSKIYLYIDKATSLITKTRVLEKSSNNRVSLSISSIVSNGAVSDAIFVFNTAKYPGVEPIDLR